MNPSSWQQLSFPLDDYPIVPFERQAMLTLISGLHALVDTAITTTKKGLFRKEAYDDIIPEGVNADLCEALLPRRRYTINAPLEIGVSWSYAVKAPTHSVSVIIIPPEILYHIKLAAEHFRQEQPRHVTIRGPVTLLRRPKITQPGIIRMQTLVEGTNYRSVQIKILDPIDYGLATDAHRSGNDLQCTGILTKCRDRYYLNFVRDIRIIE